ncbi:hypothetical protein TrLO_g9837 [Triparma laevis f. longispina]|uniref:HIT-type domain-containing protein n=1 Tax=Triparma laevis f. longispina TaxID=1714387 RepID=A0A9W7FNE7_9STRA|nr:hypothetical protein TrLO_g9837 [Triparma laevis f. longispina]
MIEDGSIVFNLGNGLVVKGKPPEPPNGAAKLAAVCAAQKKTKGVCMIRRLCAHCGVTNSSDTKPFPKCSRCSTPYCGKACQTKD